MATYNLQTASMSPLSDLGQRERIRFPNLFIVGFPRSGTTSLHYCLNQHKDIYMPPQKELFFFAQEIFQRLCPQSKPVSLEEYLEHFHDRSHKWVGEATASYIFYKPSLERIKDFLRDSGEPSKFIIMIRNPAEAVYSLYKFVFMKYRNFINEDFPTSWQNRVLKRNVNGIETADFYPWEIFNIHQHTRCYIDAFGKDRVKIILFDDFKQSPGLVYQDTLRFLGLEEDGRLNWSIQNQSFSGTGFLRRAINKLLSFDRQKFCVYPNELKTEIVSYYSNEIDGLADLIKRNLTHWKNIKNIKT